LLIVHAMLVYPVLGIVSGHVYPGQPIFGVAPCPTTIFTFGLLLLLTATRAQVPACATTGVVGDFGYQRSADYGIYEDFGLVLAGVVGLPSLIWRDDISQHEPPFSHTWLSSATGLPGRTARQSVPTLLQRSRLAHRNIRLPVVYLPQPLQAAGRTKLGWGSRPDTLAPEATGVDCASNCQQLSTLRSAFPAVAGHLARHADLL
jgi:hypothetical protein